VAVLFLTLFLAVSADLKSTIATSLHDHPATSLSDPAGDIDDVTTPSPSRFCDGQIVEAFALGEKRHFQIKSDERQTRRTCAAHI
jgi:hypothetical protein